VSVLVVATVTTPPRARRPAPRGALLAEQNDEWLVAAHRYRSETSLRKLVIHGAQEDMPAHLEAKTA
jgi:hypothetical protein